MKLFRHDRDFSIKIDGDDLMNSRQHESELELARLGCMHLTKQRAVSVLIGGLGMGYTLRQALDMVGADAKVVVGELLDAVVEWNRDFLGELNGHPLKDKRVALQTGDVVKLISRSNARFDAILLDVDNGPDAMTDPGNSRLYGFEGIEACRKALRPQGCLAVWSARPDKGFEHRLMSCGFHVRRYRVNAYKGSKSRFRFIWVASGNRKILPPGGGELKRPPRRDLRKGRGPRTHRIS